MQVWTGKKYIQVEVSDLRWVYLVLVKKKIIYIGSTQEPERRISNHVASIFARYLKGKIEIRVYGPYERMKGLDMERELLGFFNGSKNLSNKIYGKAIKKSGQKAQEFEGQSAVERRLLNEPRVVFNY